MSMKKQEGEDYLGDSKKEVGTDPEGVVEKRLLIKKHCESCQCKDSFQCMSFGCNCPCCTPEEEYQI